MAHEKIYRELLRLSSQFKDANLRSYFTRITVDDFKAAHTPDFLKAQEKNLELLKRQTEIQNMYYSDDFTARR